LVEVVVVVEVVGNMRAEDRAGFGDKASEGPQEPGATDSSCIDEESVLGVG